MMYLGPRRISPGVSKLQAAKRWWDCGGSRSRSVRTGLTFTTFTLPCQAFSAYLAGISPLQVWYTYVIASRFIELCEACASTGLCKICANPTTASLQLTVAISPIKSGLAVAAHQSSYHRGSSYSQLRLPVCMQRFESQLPVLHCFASPWHSFQCC